MPVNYHHLQVVLLSSKTYPYTNVRFALLSEETPSDGVTHLFAPRDSMSYDEAYLTVPLKEALKGGGSVYLPGCMQVRPFDWGQAVEQGDAFVGLLRTHDLVASDVYRGAMDTLVEMVKAYAVLANGLRQPDAGGMKRALAYASPGLWERVQEVFPEVQASRDHLAKGGQIFWAT